jgi:hypothetical protein
VISEELILELIRQGNENRNVDYKGAFSWDTATNDLKYEIVKDILAFANTRDGGKILIGVEDKTGAIEGLSKEQSASFDQTRVNDFVQKYTSPLHTSRVHRRTVNGHRLVVIDVPEFVEVPILCAKDAHSSSNPGRQILKKAALYKRTDKATSEGIADADEMRELLNRGLLRRQDELLRAIRGIILPRETVEVQLDTGFKAQIASAEQAVGHFKIESQNEFLAGLPHWTVEMQPEEYLPERITSASALQQLVQESAISLRGWTFPIAGRVTGAQWMNFDGGSQSLYAAPGNRPEALRVYKSGLLLWFSGLGEDFWQGAAGQNLISFVSVIYSATEWVLFAQRFYERILAVDERVHIRVRASGFEGRRLASLDSRVVLFGDYRIGESGFEIVQTTSVSALRADPESIARKIIRRIFELFNWNDPEESILAGWQQKLIQRQF